MPLLTTSSDIPSNLQGFYDRNLLENAVPIVLFDKFGQSRPLPKNSGTRINFRRYALLAANTSPLSEGVTPAGKKLSVADIYATIAQYGDFITLSDWVQLTGLDPNLLDIGENILAEQMAQSKDILSRNVLVAGTSVRYSGTATSRVTVDSPIGDDDINSIIRTLEGNNVKKIGKMLVAGSGISTVPIRHAYVAVTHPDARSDIESLTGFISVEEYASQDALSKAQGEVVEIGSVKNIRFLSTTNARIFQAGGAAVGATGMVADDATNIDVYATLVFGRDAYGIIPLQRGNVANIVKKMGSAGTEDPLDQRATSGWKMATVTKILNDDNMIRLEHAVTDL